ncbi:MAG: ribbon-helix-helix protein, CopG family [Candidatus Aminicenantes bacterium]|nr:ribbon-helix-helix protein, CopG family [Candidatus Aminicenantes bacterium]
MIRTQIYLTEEEKSALNSLSASSGKSLSRLIREAVDNLIVRYSRNRHSQVLDRAAGMWKDREDLPDFAELRKDWDRGHA